MLLATDKPDKSMDDPHRTCNVARGRNAGVASMKTFFAVLPIFLGTILDKSAANRRAGGVQFDDSIDGNANLII